MEAFEAEGDRPSGVWIDVWCILKAIGRDLSGLGKSSFPGIHT